LAFANDLQGAASTDWEGPGGSGACGYVLDCTNRGGGILGGSTKLRRWGSVLGMPLENTVGGDRGMWWAGDYEAAVVAAQCIYKT
jgi:hypothetical protein